MSIAVIEYTDPAQMRADYIARRARLYRPEPRPVAVAHEPDQPSIIPFGVRRRAIVALSLKAKLPVKDAVHDWLCLASPAATKPNSSGRILSLVADVLGVSRMDLISERRTLDIVLPRQICFYLMKTCSGMSLPQIGKCMGGRDHTTALHGIRKITALMETDAALRDLIGILTARLQAEAA